MIALGGLIGLVGMIMVIRAALGWILPKWRKPKSAQWAISGCLLIVISAAFAKTEEPKAAALAIDPQRGPDALKDRMVITSKDVAGPWPLNVPAVRVDCGNGHTSVFVEAEKVAYPFNGSATSHPGDYTGRFQMAADDRPITKLDPALSQDGPLYMDNSHLVQIAIQRCRAAGLSDL